MATATIFEVCEPRQDVKDGAIAESDFAADLAQVLRGEGPEEYRDPALFFTNTYPTRGLRDLLRSVCARLTGSGEQVASIFRLDTQYGGGKTHALIALTHAAKGMQGVSNATEFIEASLIPSGEVRIAAFDGENADPANGRLLRDGVRAFTPWGEIAWQLAGKAGYESIANSDQAGVAPGAENIRALFGNQPTLILIDELSIYLRKLKHLSREHAAGQLTAFLTALFKAVEGTPNAVLVYTLAIGKDGKASDAYSEENTFIADQMAEAESVSARKATLLNPTEEDETVQVLRRRLFSSIDEQKAAAVVASYKQLWDGNADALSTEARRPETLAAFQAGYPLHPELMATLTGKTSTLGNFQRVRGMLRLLARTVGLLWQRRPTNTYAIHSHHIDPGFEPIKGELVTRLGLKQYAPAIKNDVSAPEGEKPALSQELDGKSYGGLPPYGSFVARTVLLHTFAFNDLLKGVNPDGLRFAVLAPGVDLGFVDDARTKFIQHSSYLDDRPGAPLRFLAEANLTQVIRREQDNVDKGLVRSELNDRIKQIFNGSVFQLVPFASGPYDVPDDAADGKPSLVLLGYDAVDVGSEVNGVPTLVENIYTQKGASSDIRINRNNLLFIVADAARKDEMKKQVAKRLALIELKKPERLAELATHQQDRIAELHRRSEQEVALGIQQCYRHVFFPSKHRLPGTTTNLAHTAIDVQSTSDSPGNGQLQVARVLRESQKLRMEDDAPDSPIFIRDRTPLKKGQITTLALRGEYRKDPALPMLIGDNIFIKSIRQGVEQGEYVYRKGDLLFGKGDPYAEIHIDEQAIVFTMQYAREHGIWPRPLQKPPSGNTETGTDTGTGKGGIEETGGNKDRGGGMQPLPPPGAFTAEGPLREALTRLWEAARSAKVGQIGKLSVQLYEGGEVFRLLGAINSVAGASKKVYLQGGYVTTDGGEMLIEFTGSVDDALPVKEFLEPQLRAAKERSLTATFELVFKDGLALSGTDAEKLTEKLSRFAAGAAAVSATAEAKEGAASSEPDAALASGDQA